MDAAAILMPRKRRFAWSFKLDAVARVEAGEDLHRVADDIGVGSHLIYIWCRDERLVDGGSKPVVPKVRKPRASFDRGRTPTPAPQSVKDAAVADLIAGHPWKVIQERYGIPPSTVWRWAKKSGRFQFGEDRPVVVDPSKSVSERREHWIRRQVTPHLDAAMIEEILRLLEEGATLKSVASKVAILPSDLTKLHSNAVLNKVLDPHFIRQRRDAPFVVAMEAPASDDVDVRGSAHLPVVVEKEASTKGAWIGVSVDRATIFKGFVGGPAETEATIVFVGALLRGALSDGRTVELTVRAKGGRELVDRVEQALAEDLVVLVGRRRMRMAVEADGLRIEISEMPIVGAAA